MGGATIPFRGGLIEGYVELALVLALVAIPYLPSVFKPFDIVAGLAALLLALIFIDRGVRFGRGSSGNAARLALAILAMLTFATTISIVMALIGLASG